VASPMSPAALQDLAEIRRRHQQRYKEREEAALRAEEEARQEARQEAERREQELRDLEIAKEVAKEEEEARLQQLADDEELSRQLAEQLNPGGSAHPLQNFGRGNVETIPLDDGSDIDDQYHQMEDGDVVRAPMRTNYLDQLIPDQVPVDFRNQSPFPPLLGGFDIEEGGARELGDYHWEAMNRLRGPFCNSALMPVVCTMVTVGMGSYIGMQLLGG